jgi:thioredoxin-related protein
MRWLILACACFVTAHAGPLPVVSDLEATAKLARQQRAPVFVAFTLKNCPYCATARREYWEPMNRSDALRGKVVMVEIVLDGPQPLRDFAGRQTTVREFAKRFAVRTAPTVIVFDTQGKPVSEAVVGLASGDFYGAYLDHAIEAGLAAARKSQ